MWNFLQDEGVIVTGGVLFMTSLTVGTLLTSWMCRWSQRLGAMDRPDGQLKIHHRATPTLGGVPLFAALLISTGLLWLIPDMNTALALEQTSLPWGGILLATIVILLLGISDDLRRVMPRTKLLYQVLAALVLVTSGLMVRQIEFFGVCSFPLGALAVPFTLFWIVGSCNAFNFIDGADGLASGLGVVMALGLAVLGLMTGNLVSALLSLVLAGGLLAVLLFNIAPAKIFLGDSGSQLVGLLFGALSIRVATVEGQFHLPAAGLLLSIPVLDALLSILRRYSRSASAASGDHHHIHHCLQRLGLSVRQVSAALWLAGGLAALMALACYQADGLVMAGLALAFVMLQLYVGIRLGCLDSTAFWQKITGTYRHQIVKPEQIKNARRMAELAVFWERMKPLFEQMNLDRAVLTLEGVGEEGRSSCETYQWVRSDVILADLLASRWTKRITLDQERVAVLRLEAVRKLRRDEERINWLLREISNNMRHTSAQRQGATDTLVESEEMAGSIPS